MFLRATFTRTLSETDALIVVHNDIIVQLFNVSICTGIFVEHSLRANSRGRGGSQAMLNRAVFNSLS